MGGDTAQNTTYNSESGWDTAQENVFRCSYWGGDTADTTQNQGGTPHQKICSEVYTGVGTPQRIQRQRGDTAQRGGESAHNTTYYSESGGDTAQENVLRCSHWGGDEAENSKTEGGTPHKIKVGCWLAG